MLRISKLADYATVLMTYLALKPSSQFNAAAIAEATAIPVPTVRKLLKILAQAGLLASQRGTKGGYNLGRPADQISIAHIITAIEQPMGLGLTECSHTVGSCVIETKCLVRHNWRLIDQAIRSALESVKLADLTQSQLSSRKIDISQLKNLAGVTHGKN